MCKITVFTATYNRKNLLSRLYESLRNQTNKNFEWLIIDDESNDNTDKEVNKWIKEERSFSIRYIKQKRGGKHRALNKGFFEAKGEYFFIVDSDDYLPNNSIETCCKWLKSIEKSNSKLAGVSGLRAFPNGCISGGKPKVNNAGFIDSDGFSREKYNLTGEKAEIFKTEILRKHLFPEFEGELFATEDICWNSIYADGYKLRWFNEITYIFDYLEDGLTKSGSNEINGHIKNYRGYCYYIKQIIELFGVINRPRMFYTFLKVANYRKKRFSEIACDLNLTKKELMINYIILPVGFVKSGIKKIKKNVVNR